MGTGPQKSDGLGLEAAASDREARDRLTPIELEVSQWVFYGEERQLQEQPIITRAPWPELPSTQLKAEIEELTCQFDFKDDEKLGLVIDAFFPSIDMTQRIIFGHEGHVQRRLCSLLKLQKNKIQQKSHEAAQQGLQLSVAQQEILRLQESNRLLAEQLARFRQEQFGPSSEQVEPLNSDEAVANDVVEAPPVIKKNRLVSNAGRKPLPAHLPREDVNCDLAAAEQKCSGCDQPMKFVGDESTERLELIPAKLVVKRFIAKKYVCRCCNKFAVAPIPKSVIPGSSFGSPSVLADIVVNKYQFALPLHRLTHMYDRAGMPINRTTMANLMISLADRLTPVYERFREILLRQGVIHADETTLQVLKEPGRDPQSQSFMWQYCSGPHAAHPLAMFEYQPTRAGAHALKFLTAPDGKVFNGYLQVDGYAGYNTIQAAARVGCMAHVRRKFVEVQQSTPAVNAEESIALQPIGLIQKLYVIEAQMKTASVSERKRVRQMQSIPILNQLKAWLDEHVKLVAPKSLLGKAIYYALGQWYYVIRYVENGLLSIDNNIAERSIKNLVIGRKNWLFSTSVDGAYATAVLTTMVQSAILNKLDPYQYLVLVLNKLPYVESEKDFEEMMPWNVKAGLDVADSQARLAA
ncbi:IS66 family transposase [Comamonas testosteroni]|uniref:IS66 family transposase n=1 Tax=Comamonas testosteroni TaxID=285 RepID=UPI002DB88632|nr:IS66 family transposase [Comamonas testosteroni]MEB5964233.1 IS66 family transposase [Comamonas testosteroni]